jgi:hypothetical protein
MSQFHSLQVSSESQKAIESVAPHFIKEGLLLAREKSWRVLKEILSLLKEGMNEDDARKLALQVFSTHGVSKHWHRPYIRFGAGTALTFHDPMQKDYKLQTGDPVYLDFGPVWKDEGTGFEYEGDVGDTFVFGENSEAERCAKTARTLFAEVQKEWQTKRLTGVDIYGYLNTRANQLGYELTEQVKGHRLGDFPHQKYTKENLSDIQFCPSSSLWVLEVHIVHPNRTLGAFYEDTL